MSMDETAAQLAHVLRRLTFGPHPGDVERLRSAGADGVIDALLGRTEDDGKVRAHADHALLELPDSALRLEWDDFTLWWLEQMGAPSSGLHEKLVWFWHGHFTSTASKSGDAAMVAQHAKLRRHALGNFRDFAKAMVTDGAMMMYLDAAGSQGDAPNENLARELMELFTLGRGTYSEQDVREAAKALAGWWVDWETGETEYDEYIAYQGVIRFLGQRGRFTPEDIVDIICDQPSCAPFIAAKLYRYLVGVEPSPERLSELAETFAGSGLEIGVLVQAIVDDPAFLAERNTRPRYAIEWFVAAHGVLGTSFDNKDLLWMLDGLGQRPGYPPNPAGWPEGDRWLSASASLVKANVLFNAFFKDEDDATFPFDEEDAVTDALAYCGLYEPSDTMLKALDEAYWSPFDADDVNLLLVQLALTSTEFSLA